MGGGSDSGVPPAVVPPLPGAPNVGVTAVGPLRNALGAPVNVGVEALNVTGASGAAAAIGSGIPLRRRIAIKTIVENEILNNLIFSVPYANS
jgi:hypothetical protein